MADNNNFGIQQAPKPMSEDMGNPDGKLGGYNEYDDIVANPDVVKKQEIQASRYIADRTTPERAAQIEQLSKKTKLPKEIVERNFEQVAKLPEADENDYDKLIQTNPGLTEYLRDPNNYAMSKDDIQNIKKIEDNVQDYSMLSSAYDALYTGMGKVNASIAKTPAALLQFAYTPQNIIADYFNVPGLKVEIPSNWINNDLAKYYEDAANAKAPPELSQSVIDELKSGNYSRAGRVAAVQAISNIPNFGLMMLGGMYSKAAGLGVAGATSAASKLGENVERKDLTSTQKEVSAIATGTFEAAFENLGTFGVLKHWEEAIGKEFGKQVSKEWVKSFAKTLGYSIASEGNEEFWTQVAQDTTDHLLGVEKFTPEEIGKRSLEAGIGGAIFGFGMTSPTGALLGIHANRQKKDALLARDFHIALGDSIEASRSKQRLPEAAKKIVDTIVKNGPVQNVYISPEAIEQYYQKNDLNAVEQMQKADVLAEFEKAKEEGRDMKIPLSDFATKMAPEHYKGLADDIKYDPTKASVNEAKAREEEIKEDIKKIVEDSTKEQKELTNEQKAKQVSGEIAKQLEDSGMDKSQSIIFEKFFQKLGERTGTDPLELYKQYPLFIDKNKIQVESESDLKTLYQTRPIEFKPYVSPIGFYSQVESEVLKMDFKSIPSKDLSNRIKNIQGLKKEELEWIGFNDWLESEDRKVTKEEVINFIRSNGIKVTQTVLSENYEGTEDASSEADWSDPVRYYDYDEDSIEDEANYYLKENDEWIKENTEELTKEFIQENSDEDGSYDTKELEKFLQRNLEDRAYESAREYVESDDYPGARYIVEEETSGETLEGSDEFGWYSEKYGEMGYNLEEAKIILTGKLIEDERLVGSIANLIKAEDIEWSNPTSLVVDYDKIQKEAKKRVKKDPEKYKKLALEEYSYRYDGENLNSVANKKKIKEDSLSVANREIQDELNDPSNLENNITVVIKSDILESRLERKHGQWALRFEEGGRNKIEKVIDIDAKDIDSAKNEAIQKLLDRGLITSKNQVTSQTQEDVNKPTGETIHAIRGRVLEGGKNHREFLLHVNSEDPYGFVERAHFPQKDIIAFIRVSDRIDKDGKKMLFIEEMQSDWHQQGREKGYKTKKDKARLEELRKKKSELLDKAYEAKEKWDAAEKESRNAYDRLEDEIEKKVPQLALVNKTSKANLMVSLANIVLRSISAPGMTDQFMIELIESHDAFNGHGKEILEALKSDQITNLKDAYLKENENANKLSSDYHSLKQQVDEVDTEQSLISGSVADAPYKQTDAWSSLALKRMIRLAAEQGYDSIGWTPGEVHSERWGTDEFSWKLEQPNRPWKIVTKDGVDYQYFDTKEDAEMFVRDTNSDASVVPSEPYFLVGATRQRGGRYGEVNIEQLAAQRGEQLKEDGKIVKSEDDLFNVLSRVLGKDKSDRSLRSIADATWKKMQSEPEGTKQPRAEGMKFFYDNILPKKAAPDVLKKLDKSAKIEVGKIDTKDGRKLRLELNEKETQYQGIDMYDAVTESGSVAFTGTEKEASKYLEEETGRMSIWEIKLTDQIKKNIMEGQTLFQKSDQYKGQIKLEAQRAVITFTQSADRSTFFHESGHYFLEVLRRQAEKANAPQEIKDDFNTIMNWFGITDPSQISVEHHEKWAEGFENYIFEGKAPTSALQKAFARFRVWLVGVYKNLSGMKTKFSPEVKEVMDRLLTTEDEIEAKNFEMHREPLFGDPKSIGMTDKEAYDYMNKVDEALEESKAELNRKALAHIDKEQKKIRKEEFDFLRPQVEKEVSKQRIYQSLDKIENNKELKISRESLKAYGDDVPKNIPKKVIAKKGEGQPIEVVASLLGYETHNEFITELTNVREKDELIDELTNREVERQNPDLFQNNLTDEAAKAMHNRKRSQVLRMEFDYLSKNHQGTLKKLTKRLIKRMPSDSEIKAAAKARIGEYSINDLNPKVFLRAEIKAAKDTADAYSKGDFDKAIESKRMEILNHEMFLQAQEANDLVEKANKLYKKLFKKDEELAKVRDLDLVNAGRAMLAKYGLSEKMDRVETYLKQLKQYDPESYENISLLVESLPVEMPAEELKFSDYEKIYDTVDAIWSLAREVRQLTIEGKKVEKKKALEELSTQIDQVSGKSDAFDMKYAGSMTIGESLKNMTLGIRSNLRRVESFVESFDQGSSGPFRKYIWNPVKSAIDTFRVEKKKVTDQYKKIVEDHKEIFDTNPIPAPELNTNFKDKSELIGALLHTGNKSNYRKLIVGRGWGSVDENGVVDDADWKRFIDRMHKEGKLTAKDYQFVQSVWDLFETLKPAAWSAHKKMYGFFPNEVTADSFENEFGKFKGGYAPAVVDPDRSNEALNREQKEIMEKTGNSFMFPTTGRGFTKSRVVYDAPLLIDMRLVGSHIDKVLRFSYVEPAVKEVARLVMDKSFQAKIDSVDKHITTDMLVPWLQRSAQQSLNTMRLTGTLSGLDRFAAYLRGNAGLQIMGLNFINSMQNISGLAMGAVKVKPKYMYSGLIRYMKSPKKYAEEVANRSVFMSTRLGDQVSDILSDVDDILVKPSVTDTIKKSAVKHSRILQTITQNLVDLSVWGGAYDQAIGDGMSESEAVKIADSTVRQTQGSNNPEDVSRLETGPAVARLFTMFYTYFNMQANLLGTEFTKVARDMGLKKGAGRGLYVYTMGMLIPAFLGSVLFKLLSGSDFDDDDDGEYIDDISSQFFFSQIQNLTAMIPVGGAIFNVGINKFNDKPFDDRLTMSPAVTMIESGAGLAAETYRAITDQGNLKRLVKDALSTVGLLTGLPLGPVGKPIGYLMDVNEGNISPSGPIDFTRGLITGKDESK